MYVTKIKYYLLTGTLCLEIYWVGFE